MFRTIPIALTLVLLVAGPAAAANQPLDLQPVAKKATPGKDGGQPVQTAPVAPPLDPQTVVLKADGYFNDASTLIADFVQIGPDGRRSDGKLYVDRPGKMRFTYDPPATLDIVADGTSVAVIDRKLHTQDLYFIAQTPLKFLLNDRVDLEHDTHIVSATSDAKGAYLDLEDRSTFGGTSRLRLVFDLNPFILKQWTVTDPQGYETVVSLSNIDASTKPDSSLFKIAVERTLNSRK